MQVFFIRFCMILCAGCHVILIGKKRRWSCDTQSMPCGDRRIVRLAHVFDAQTGLAPVCMPNGSRVESLAGACSAGGRGLFAAADRGNLPHVALPSIRSRALGLMLALAADSAPPSCEATAATVSTPDGCPMRISIFSPGCKSGSHDDSQNGRSGSGYDGTCADASPGSSCGMKLCGLPTLIVIVRRRPAPDAPKISPGRLVVVEIAFCDDRPLFNGVGDGPFADFCLPDT